MLDVWCFECQEWVSEWICLEFLCHDKTNGACSFAWRGEESSGLWWVNQGVQCTVEKEPKTLVKKGADQTTDQAASLGREKKKSHLEKGKRRGWRERKKEEERSYGLALLCLCGWNGMGNGARNAQREKESGREMAGDKSKSWLIIRRLKGIKGATKKMGGK